MDSLADATDRPAGLLFGPGPAGAWDDERVSGPRVLRAADGTWRMWYYGRDTRFDREINLASGRCGLAQSADGLTWQRVPGPLTGGSVFEAHSDPARFDSAHVGGSDVHEHDGLYWMWYLGGDHSRQQFGQFAVKGMNLRPGCAISRDGLHTRASLPMAIARSDSRPRAMRSIGSDAPALRPTVPSSPMHPVAPGAGTPTWSARPASCRCPTTALACITSGRSRRPAASPTRWPCATRSDWHSATDPITRFGGAGSGRRARFSMVCINHGVVRCTATRLLLASLLR